MLTSPDGLALYQSASAIALTAAIYLLASRNDDKDMPASARTPTGVATRDAPAGL
jgi:hypothetical protein